VNPSIPWRRAPALVGFALWLAGTAAARGGPQEQEQQPAEAPASRVEVRRDLPYLAVPPAKAGNTKLDLFFAGEPTGAGKMGTRLEREPIVVFVHGGAWRGGDKANHDTKAQRFVAEGFVFASINYRLHPAVEVGAQAQDVAHAVSWVARNADTFGGDGERVFLIGHSAGAHLAALVAADPVFLRTARFQRSNLRGVVLLDGAAYDLLEPQGDEPELVRQIFGGDLEQRRRLSPIHQLNAGASSPPHLIIHVARPPSAAASGALAQRLREIGATAILREAAGKTHQSLNRELGLDGDAPTAWVLDFLRAELVVGPVTEPSVVSLP
jgi:acetyl esterase/lipase